MAVCGKNSKSHAILFLSSFRHCQEAGEIELEVLHAFLEYFQAIELCASLRTEDGSVGREDALRKVAGRLGSVVAFFDAGCRETALYEHLALFECLVMGGDGLDVCHLGAVPDQEAVDDGNLEEFLDIEDVAAHRIYALNDDAAVRVLDGEDAHVDFFIFQRAEHILDRDQVFELVAFDAVLSAIFIGGLLGEAADGAGNADHFFLHIFSSKRLSSFINFLRVLPA